MLSGENFQAKAEAMTPMKVQFLPSDVFLKLLKLDPKLSYAMLQKIAQRPT